MSVGELVPLVAVVMIFSIPISAIWAGALKARYKAQQNTLSGNDREQLAKLAATAETMAQRIETLEAILDAEVPDWRDDYENK